MKPSDWGKLTYYCLASLGVALLLALIEWTLKG